MAFDLLRGPAAGIGTPEVWWRGLLVCAVDGTLMALPDSEANLTVFTKHRCDNGGAGYPALSCWYRSAAAPALCWTRGRAGQRR